LTLSALLLCALGSRKLRSGGVCVVKVLFNAPAAQHFALFIAFSQLVLSCVRGVALLPCLKVFLMSSTFITSKIVKPLTLSTATLSLVSAAVLATFSSGSMAQSATPELPLVVVTASRLPQTLPDTIANTTLITRSDIDRSGAVDLPALLAGQAGIEIARNGGVGQTASIFMRGAGSAQTLVLIDGVSVNDNNFGTARLELIPLDAIDRIEIVRGNVSAQYGSQAIGGVIQLFTRTPKSGINASVSAELGTQDYKKVSATVAAGNEATQIRLTASRLDIKGVSAQNPIQSPGVNPDADGTGQTALQLSVNHAVSSDLKLNANLLKSTQSTDYDGSGAITTKHTTDQNLLLGSVGASWAINSGWTTGLKLSKQKSDGHDEKNAVATSDNQSKRQLINFTNTINVGLAGNLLAGLDLQKDSFAAESYGTYGSKTAQVERRVQAGFLGLQGKHGAIAWNAALRSDKDNVADSEKSTTYQLGGSYDFSPAWSIRGQTSTAFNRPTLNQLYLPFYGNTALKAEHAKNNEIGVQWVQAGSLIRVTGFKSSVKDLLGYDPSTYQNININSTHNRGVELIGEFAMPWAGGKLKTGLSKQNPIDDATGLTLQRRNKLQTNLGLQGAIGAWSWDTNLTYQGNRNDVDYSGYPYADVVLKSYAKLDAQVRYNFNQQFSASLDLSNLTKANDQTAYGYNGTPRGAVLRLNYKL
jgi:vitamin B12 transporter